MKTHGFEGGEYVFLKLRFSEVPPSAPVLNLAVFENILKMFSF